MAAKSGRPDEGGAAALGSSGLFLDLDFEDGERNHRSAPSKRQDSLQGRLMVCDGFDFNPFGFVDELSRDAVGSHTPGNAVHLSGLIADPDVAPVAAAPKAPAKNATPAAAGAAGGRPGASRFGTADGRAARHRGTRAAPTPRQPERPLPPLVKAAGRRTG